MGNPQSSNPSSLTLISTPQPYSLKREAAHPKRLARDSKTEQAVEKALGFQNWGLGFRDYHT